VKFDVYNKFYLYPSRPFLMMTHAFSGPAFCGKENPQNLESPVRMCAYA